MLNNVEVVPFKVAAYHKGKQAMAFFDGAHEEDFEFISGSRMREIVLGGEPLPPGFMSPKGWQVLREYYARP